MLQYKVRSGKLVSLSYRVGDARYNLNYLKKSTSVWNMFQTLILAGDVDAATKLYKLAFSIAACNKWKRVASGYWCVLYGGHIIHVCSAGPVEVTIKRANKYSQVPEDLAVKAAEIAYYIRRRRYEQRVEQAAERDTRRTYRTQRTR